MKKVIYIYSDSVPNQFKIGKADQRTDQNTNISLDEIGQNRISEQQTASSRGKINVHGILDISEAEDSLVVESFIHGKLVEMGYDRIKRDLIHNGETFKEGKSEWFSINDLSSDEVVSLIDSFIRQCLNKSGKPSYTPRVYQSYIKALTLDRVVAGDKTILTELAPRFGKTLWSLDLFNTLHSDFNYQYMLLPAYVLTAHSSFKKDFNKYKDFNDFIYIDDKDSDFEQKVLMNKDKKLLITISLHTSEDGYDKYKCLDTLDSNKKVAFIDEADFGAHTSTSRKVIDLLKCKLRILMTGTAIERAAANYGVGDVIKWSYTDMLLLKNGNHPLLSKLGA
jgi:hypothetical protein